MPSEAMLMRSVRDLRRAATTLLRETGYNPTTHEAMRLFHVSANALRARFPRNGELYENGNGGDPR